MSIVFDRAVGFYDQTRGLPPEAEPWVAQLVREHTQLQPGSQVLELGVGTGRIALPLTRQNGYRYTGVDLSVEMMSRLRQKAGDLPIVLAEADAAQIPFGDATFDAIVAVHIFHLIDRWQDAMDEAQRVLKPGGVLLHGRNSHVGTATAWMMRRKLDEFANARRERRNAGLLDQADIRPQLEWRFGPPREVVTPRWERTRTPQHMLDDVRQRIYSATWLLSDETIAAVVEKGRRWALDQFGSLDSPLIDEQYFTWEIYTKRPTP